MTINVVVSTYHGVVLGCDSLSSKMESAYFPLRTPNALARDTQGNPLKDNDGNLLLKYSPKNLIETPTDIYSGVQKMFLLHESKSDAKVDCSIAAITSGMAALNGVVIAEIASNFLSEVARKKRKTYLTAQGVANDFISYVRPLWEDSVNYSNIPEFNRPYLQQFNFMLSGYGPNDKYIKVFRVTIGNNEAKEEFSPHDHCGAAWGGQPDSVACLLTGSNPITRNAIHNEVLKTLTEQRDSIASSLLDQFHKQGGVPNGIFSANINNPKIPELPWRAGSPNFDWAHLSVQSAIDLTSTLVNAESAIQKFSMGIPTVGGRTHIGLMRRGMPFKMINEPKVTHQHAEYSDDA